MKTCSSAIDSGCRWFEHLSNARAPSLCLFCFPYAGGSADVYRNWRRWLPEHIDLCLVHLPGRGRSMGERAFTRLTAMVDAVLDRIDRRTEAPYALFGHSMGALICFELARKLFCRSRSGPKHLFVSGHRAPQCSRNEPATFNLPYDKFIAELRKLNGTPQEFLGHPELMQLFMNVLRADFEAVETYEYLSGEPLSCPITVYGGLDDERVPMESCHAWQKQTSASCKVRMFKGDHFFIRNPGKEFIDAFRSDLLEAVPALHSTM